jgi:hypothetical protein
LAIGRVLLEALGATLSWKCAGGQLASLIGRQRTLALNSLRRTMYNA